MAEVSAKSWKPTGWLLAAGALIVVVFLHHEVILQGQIYHHEDAADGYYPAHVAITRALGQGHLPVWENGVWTGWPLVSDPYYGTFYPLNFLFHLLGAARGLGATLALHMTIAILAMFAFLRSQGLRCTAAALGAFSYGLSSFFVVRTRHIVFAETLALLPVLFWGSELVRSGRRMTGAVLLFAGTAMVYLSGGFPLAPYIEMLWVGYLLARLHGDRAWRRTIMWSGVGHFLGLLGAGAQIWPTLAHLPYSPRAMGVDIDFAGSYAWPSLEYIGTLVLPNLLGGEERGAWFGRFNHWEMAGYYVGAAAILLGLYGVLQARRRRELAIFSVLSVFAVVFAWGTRTPLFAACFRWLPLFSSLRCPPRALVMWVFAVPVLAAWGLQSLSEPQLRSRWRLVWPTIAAIGLVVTLVVMFKFARTPPEKAGFRAAVHFFAVATMVAALAVWARPRWRNRLLVFVVIADLLIINRGYVAPKPADFDRGTQYFSAVDWLLKQKPADRFAIDPRGPFRLHNLGLVYPQLEGAGGYDSVTIWRYVHYLYALNHGRPYPYPKLKDDVAAGDIFNFDSPLADFLNVRWLIAPHAPSPRWIERYRPNPALPPLARHEAAWDRELKVFENSAVLPRAFAVYQVKVIADDRAQVEALATLDPRTTAILDRAPCEAFTEKSRPFTPARVIVHDAQHVAIDVRAEAPAVVVLSDAYYPGWSATVDGHLAPLFRANHAFRAVAVEVGQHHIEMSYRPWPVYWGIGLSLATFWAVLLVWGFFRLRGNLV